ncbi:MAG: fructose-6-phosphate aldolase [Deltaproteobacteria bacterium]|nr:fructose-6-phosphate aldolase [Deltaproteobacteria bacterium]
MTLFLDTANLDEIREIAELGVIRGVTTNQKILLKSGVSYDNYKEVIREICELVQGPVSVELTRTYAPVHSLVSEARELAEINGWVVVKVPMWSDGRGLAVINQLSEMDIKTNATCLMSARQGVLAAEAGATYVSLFYNRMIEELSTRTLAMEEIFRMRTYLEDHDLDTKIIAGSIRNPNDVMECFNAGAHIVTVPYKHLKALIPHPRTESTIREFDEAWEKLKEGGDRT